MSNLWQVGLFNISPIEHNLLRPSYSFNTKYFTIHSCLHASNLRIWAIGIGIMQEAVRGGGRLFKGPNEGYPLVKKIKISFTQIFTKLLGVQNASPTRVSHIPPSPHIRILSVHFVQFFFLAYSSFHK